VSLFATNHIPFFWAAVALIALFVVVNVAARFRYTIEGEYLVARWFVLWVVPFQKSRVKLTKISSIDRFSWKSDALRYFRPFGRPFSREAAIIRFSGMRGPMFVSPDDFEQFRQNVLQAREAILLGDVPRS
jgi:hypothetical protein